MRTEYMSPGAGVKKLVDCADVLASTLMEIETVMPGSTMDFGESGCILFRLSNS